MEYFERHHIARAIFALDIYPACLVQSGDAALGDGNVVI